MELSHLYATRIRDALKGAVDTGKLAAAWIALHPHDAAKARVTPGMGPLRERANQAIQQALRDVLPDAAAEGYVLGQQAAKALAADLPEVDWAGWTPGDAEAARQVAGAGLRDLLADQEVTIKSISGSRLEELGDVLARYIGSTSVGRVPVEEGPLEPEYSVGALADALEGVLDDPSMAMMVAQTEIARAQSAAAQEVYRLLGVGQVEVSSAGDSRVCPRCAAAEQAGPQPMGTYSVPLHPMCRCALLPVIPVGQALATLAGRL